MTVGREHRRVGVELLVDQRLGKTVHATLEAEQVTTSLTRSLRAEDGVSPTPLELHLVQRNARAEHLPRLVTPIRSANPRHAPGVGDGEEGNALAIGSPGGTVGFTDVTRELCERTIG